jgi:hypothetical protein
MAGCMAALAAAQGGARVLLVERWGFLGGAATAGAVGQFVGWETAAGRRVIGGLGAELVRRLVAAGIADGHGHFTMSTGHRMDRVNYEPEALKGALDDWMADRGVTVLFHAAIAEVSRDGRAVSAVRLLTRGGMLEVRPRIVVDASGELDLMARAGAAFLPLDPGETLQPATLMFRFGPVDFAAFEAIPPAERAALARRGVESGALARAALHAARVPGTDDAWFNITRVAVDATDPFALSAAEAEGRRQAFRAARFLREEVPGCGAGRLVALAPQIGIRETRRIHGLHVLTAGELRAGTRFADTVALGAYPIDIHPAQGAGLGFEELGADHAYALPYRSLVPAGLDNALVAGRGISATHEANGAIRVMPIAMALGQAAGSAAALLAAGNATAGALDVAALRERLRADGAVLDG